VKTHVSHSFDFGSGGNAVQIQLSGWSVTERLHTWCVGKRSTLAIENVVAPHGFFLEIDWNPFVAYPYRPDQGVSITVLDHRISPYRLTERETAAFYCPPPAATDKKILITFEHLDTAKIADFVETTDPREVAIAFRQVRILPLDEPPPMRLSNMSAAKVTTAGGQITIPGPQGATSMELRGLLTQFEMLAGNCDLGLSMRALGFEQLSLLRFAGATTESAIRGLENDFEGIGEQLTTEIADNPIKEWMVRDGFGLRFHTHQSSEAMTEAEILKRQRLHVQFLRRKFLEDLQLAEKIFVYADHLRPRTFESALALFLALNRRGKHRMLWVCPNLEEVAPGRVDELVPGLARGSLDTFAGPLEAGHITVSGWVNVLFNAAVVLNRGRGGSARSLGRNV
jgi:hypothetical protein